MLACQVVGKVGYVGEACLSPASRLSRLVWDKAKTRPVAAWSAYNDGFVPRLVAEYRTLELRRGSTRLIIRVAGIGPWCHFLRSQAPLEGTLVARCRSV